MSLRYWVLMRKGGIIKIMLREVNRVCLGTYSFWYILRTHLFWNIILRAWQLGFLLFSLLSWILPFVSHLLWKKVAHIFSYSSYLLHLINFGSGSKKVTLFNGTFRCGFEDIKPFPLDTPSLSTWFVCWLSLLIQV